MPVENEFNYALRLSDALADLRPALEMDRGSVVRQRILQGYLREGLRIRWIEDLDTSVVERVLSFKMKVKGETVECEMPLDPEDFDKLWSKREVSLKKFRYKFADEDPARHWDVDFFGGRKGCYFVKAECEVPAGVEDAPSLHPRLAPFLLYAAGKEKGFSSRRLADKDYAARLMERLLADEVMPGLAA